MTRDELEELRDALFRDDYHDRDGALADLIRKKVDEELEGIEEALFELGEYLGNENGGCYPPSTPRSLH